MYAPYKDRIKEQEIARSMRREGYGYTAIKRVIGIPTSTIKRWVADIPVKKDAAFRDHISKMLSEPISSENSKSTIRRKLIFHRGHSCESCKLSEWMGNKITLEVHHVDGDNSNRHESNLKLLCPNCHSLTRNWRRKKVSLTI